jgi:DNA-binding CsgD family transcriptional regulator
LYRGTNRAFDARDTDRLATAFRHVVCARDINRAHALDIQASPNKKRALALTSRSGIFESCDKNFLSILRNEWNDLQDTRLPPAAMQAVHDNQAFCGKNVEIEFSMRGDFILCEAKSINLDTTLSARERQVAHYFSLGHSYKEIAKILGISPNTVRVQLASVYRKLEINDKTMLAKALAS